MLKTIATKHHRILEVGCGQGTDAITICQLMDVSGEYTAVDLSSLSLANARSGVEEVISGLSVKPLFKTENAECLQFADNSFDCVLSVGALHHTENTGQAISEIRRVLEPSGIAYVCLYRTVAPKLIVAHLLRGVQRGVDGLLETDRAFYHLIRASRIKRYAGTAVHECFGVPILRSYTAREVRALFRNFSFVRLSCHGVGLPPIGCNRFIERVGGKLFGYLWLAEAVK